MSTDRIRRRLLLLTSNPRSRIALTIKPLNQDCLHNEPVGLFCCSTAALDKILGMGLSEKPKSNKRRLLIKKGMEAKLVEDDKLTLILKGVSANSKVNSLLSDINALKKPLCVKLPLREPSNLFEDPSKIVSLAVKSESNLIITGDSKKKSPMSLTLARLFNKNLLDVMELGVSNYVPMSNFKSQSACTVGTKPIILFQVS